MTNSPLTLPLLFSSAARQAPLGTTAATCGGQSVNDARLFDSRLPPNRHRLPVSSLSNPHNDDNIHSKNKMPIRVLYTQRDEEINNNAIIICTHKDIPQWLPARFDDYTACSAFGKLLHTIVYNQKTEKIVSSQIHNNGYRATSFKIKNYNYSNKLKSHNKKIKKQYA